MSAEVWTWVMLAAVGHALWNAVARQVAGDIAVMWLAFAVGMIVMIPPSIYVWWKSGPPNLNSMTLLCLLATGIIHACLLYTSPSPRDLSTSRMPSSA